MLPAGSGSQCSASKFLASKLHWSHRDLLPRKRGKGFECEIHYKNSSPSKLKSMCGAPAGTPSNSTQLGQWPGIWATSGAGVGGDPAAFQMFDSNPQQSSILAHGQRMMGIVVLQIMDRSNLPHSWQKVFWIISNAASPSCYHSVSVVCSFHCVGCVHSGHSAPSHNPGRRPLWSCRKSFCSSILPVVKTLTKWQRGGEPLLTFGQGASDSWSLCSCQNGWPPDGQVKKIKVRLFYLKPSMVNQMFWHSSPHHPSPLVMLAVAEAVWYSTNVPSSPGSSCCWKCAFKHCKGQMVWCVRDLNGSIILS